MDLHAFFIKRWESELPAFGKVLRAIPGDQLSYRPHERSAAAGNLAWQLVQEQGQMADLVDKGECHFELVPRPQTIDEIVAAWDKSADELRARLASLTAESSAAPARFFMNGQCVWTSNLGDMLWGYLFDMVHHRGQLSAYLRPMGGKVPSIYGPSADDSGT